jgi:peptidoglycan/LPS O-acetylase OafA/YrhL
MSPDATDAGNVADADERMLGVELLRFASALAVLVFHYQHWAFVGLSGPGFVKTDQPFYGPLSFFYDYGSYGVQVFWCISGFIFFWKYGRTISEGRVSGRTFFALRFSRLYPLHLATLLFVAIMQYMYRTEVGEYFVYHYNDLRHFLLQLGMASNWGLQAGDSFNGPIWSISIEVLVYTLFYLGLRAWGSSLPGLLAVLAVAMLIIVLKISDHPVFQCVRFFYTGCIVAVAYEYSRHSASLRRLLASTGLMALAVATAALAYGLIRPLQYVSIAAPAAIYVAVAFVRLRGTWAAVVALAGNTTYASYLLHVPLQILLCLALHMLGIDVPWRNPAFLILFLSGTLALSHLCYVYYEMPAQRILRSRMMMSRKVATDGASVS